jgi:hypothetical protein
VDSRTDRAERTPLVPWRLAPEDLERQMRPDRRERRRRPFTRRQILSIRLSILLVGVFCVTVLALDLPAASLWRREALTLPFAILVGLIWCTPHQIGQILGLRPSISRRH